ncbi:reverse transcriptase domain-containing protein [Tanacetum coccineum]
MTHLLEKNTPFIFSDECIQAFETLKKKLTEAPILIAPDWDLPFELMCDATSDFAIGAVLGQRHEKHFRPIHYASKTMTEAESHYTTTEKRNVYRGVPLRKILVLPHLEQKHFTTWIAQFANYQRGVSRSKKLLISPIASHRGRHRGHYGANYTAKKVFDSGFIAYNFTEMPGLGHPKMSRIFEASGVVLRDEDNGDSSGDDADDKNEDEDEKDEDKEDEEEEEEEHLAPADSAVVVPTVELELLTASGSIIPSPEAMSERLLSHAYSHTTITPYLLSPPSVGYEVRENSTARPTGGQGIDYGFVSTVDVEESVRGLERLGMVLGYLGGSAEADPVIVLLTEGRDSHITTSHYRVAGVACALEEAYASERLGLCLGLSQAAHYELQTHREQVYAHESQLHAHQTQLQLQGTLIQTQHQVHETRSQMQQAEMAELRETDRRRQAQIVETLRVMRDMRREMGDMQAELLALREQQRRARQPGPDVRVPDHQDASRDADSHI